MNNLASLQAQIARLVEAQGKVAVLSDDYNRIDERISELRNQAAPLEEAERLAKEREAERQDREAERQARDREAKRQERKEEAERLAREAKRQARDREAERQHALAIVQEATKVAEAHARTAQAAAQNQGFQLQRVVAGAASSLTIATPEPTSAPGVPGFHKDDVNLKSFPAINEVKWFTDDERRAPAESVRQDAFMRVAEAMSVAGKFLTRLHHNVVADTHKTYFLKKRVGHHGYAPDVTLLVGGSDPQNPTSFGTLAVGDIKTDGGVTESHLEQLFRYAQVLLKDLGREFVWAFITNLNTITFFKITLGTIEQHDTLPFAGIDSPGAKALFGLIKADPETLLGYHHGYISTFAGAGVGFKELLGQGTDGAVFKVEVAVAGERQTCALKVYKKGRVDVTREPAVLRALAGVEGVPRVLDVDLGGCEGRGRALFLQPLGEHVELTVECACELVDILGKVHEAGYVHRDVRLPNIMTTAGEGGKRSALLVDFGVAVRITAGQQPYWGTISTASDAVLDVLERLEGDPADERHHEATASDDLVALVRSIAQILFPALNARVRLTAAEAGQQVVNRTLQANALHGVRARLLKSIWASEESNPVSWPELALEPYRRALVAAKAIEYNDLKEDIRSLYKTAARPGPW